VQIFCHTNSGPVKEIFLFSQLQLKACDGEFLSDQQCTEIETDVRLRMGKEYEPTFDVHEWETSFTGKYATVKTFIRFYIRLCIKILYYTHIFSHPFKKLAAICKNQILGAPSQQPIAAPHYMSIHKK